jgi:hypothetical protein
VNGEPLVYRPVRAQGDQPRAHFRRGKTKPKGVVWFGLSSFWGHLRHFLASAIATEDVDSRDWMTPDNPETLVARIASRLGGDVSKETLGECLGREFWIDFVADTGDDVDVSERVAELIAADYELPDPDRPGAWIHAPRGEILLFGGDTAYPVATGEEINNRVMVPFNRVLSKVDDGKPRALLGIPGNHDWYDGLDGFARMFRLRPDQDEEVARPSVVNIEHHTLEKYADWAKKFMKGGHIEKPKTLNLLGYAPMQCASYFLLPLTPKIHLFAVDRQLKSLDFRQRRFFNDWQLQNPGIAPWILLPDPPFKFGEPARHGMLMLRALHFRLGDERALVMTGDVHHYARWSEGRTDFVTAGGGGAFLHPARLYNRSAAPRDREWPGPRQSARLLMGVPWKVARGRSGFIPHIVYALMFTPQLLVALTKDPSFIQELLAFTAVFVITSTIYALIGGVRRGRHGLVSLLAACTGALTACVPLAAAHAAAAMMGISGLALDPWVPGLVMVLLSCFLSAFIFGAYLALLTRVGLEHTQAFTALDHPGFKHFLRLRVRASEDRIDGWCLGLVDPLAKGAKPELVDQFTFFADTLRS